MPAADVKECLDHLDSPSADCLPIVAVYRIAEGATLLEMGLRRQGNEALAGAERILGRLPETPSKRELQKWLRSHR